MRIRIWGLMTKILFLIKNYNFPRPSWKTSWATGDASSPQKPALQNMKFTSLFSTSMGHIWPNGSGSSRPKPLRIHAEPDPQHWSKAVFQIHGIFLWIRIRGSMPLTFGSGFGSIPLNNGSESGRPKNMWIRNTDKRYIISQPDPRGAYPGSSVGRALSRHCAEQNKCVLGPYVMKTSLTTFQCNIWPPGSGSSRPKPMRIRIHNTGQKVHFFPAGSLWCLPRFLCR